MKEIKPLQFLRTIKTGKGLIKLIISLRSIRRVNKVKDVKRSALTKKQRQLILEKTDCRCHICGIELELKNFHADHVKPQITGGIHAENNYLPSCASCNNLRWHYSSEEIQLILKMGRWMKTKLLDESEESLFIANAFMKHDMQLRKKRKTNKTE
ncbi:HNH endonuclease [Panacibacter sp. DH6]|uniref:HNH endonuclease n=1 Tax=Panacibacter microcysteis TaxID=2793269 RepID=A0A931GW47_9BACT|nr:HNH endonuclease signature motif containing protein [Panacibacter microcysteis]MBG9377185.1 HNH endonuclease [Panacibacter microcysteis]